MTAMVDESTLVLFKVAGSMELSTCGSPDTKNVNSCGP